MKKNITKKAICVILIIASLLSIIGCDNKEKEKELVISNNIQQDVKNKENKEFKVEKLSELNITAESITPLFWKDDENIIGIDYIITTSTQQSSNYNIYSINIKTSTVTIIDTLSNVSRQPQAFESNGYKILYGKGNMLYTYNFQDKTTSQLYDISQIESVIPPHYGIVEGSDKYLYINSRSAQQGKVEDTIRILDLETKKILVTIPLNQLVCSDTIKYSKTNDIFYLNLMSSIGVSSTYIYEFKLNNPNDIKKIDKLTNYNLTSITDDGKELILSKGNIGTETPIRSIAKYDLTNDKLVDLLSIKASDNTLGGYFNVYLKKNCNFISYMETEGEGYSTKLSTFIGSYENNKISNIQKLQTEPIDKFIIGDCKLLFNKKCNMLLYKVGYFDSIKQSRDGAIFKYYIYKLIN